MADNVTINPGTGGPAIAADDIGGVAHQRVKVVLGADGVSDGDVSAANPMPVSGPVTDAQLRATAVPVAGTFWQTTQPVSGTFWQATQPVSIAATVAVSGTFWQATQPVSLASLPALAAGTANIGDVDVLTLPALPTGTNTIGGVKIKDDAVRCCIKFHNTSAVAETLLSVVKQLGDAADPAGATSIAVTSGKRLKITSVVYTLKANAATAAFATLNIRSLHNGATLIGSPSVLRIEIGLTAATAGSAITETVPCDLEFSGTQTLGLTLACQATTNVHSITLIGYEYTP